MTWESRAVFKLHKVYAGQVNKQTGAPKNKTKARYLEGQICSIDYLSKTIVSERNPISQLKNFMVSGKWGFKLLGKDNPHFTNLLIVAIKCTGITTASQAIITGLWEEERGGLILLEAGWQKLREGTKVLRLKVWTWMKIYDLRIFLEDFGQERGFFKVENSALCVYPH